MRPVLVTGASGVLGRYVSRQLARRGDHVIGIGHGAWDSSAWKSWGLAEWHKNSVTLESLLAAGGKPRLIVHCAGSGSVPYSLTHPLQDFERTVATTAHVMEFARLSAEPCAVVYPSSASVYGAANRERLVETDALTPLSRYGEHKAMAESIVSSFAKQFDIACAQARLFSVYGPGQRKQLLWDACHKMSQGDFVFFGSGEEVRDWLHAEDAASFMLVAAGHASPQCPIANVAAGVGVRVRDVLSQVGRALLGFEPPLQFSGRARPGDPDRFVADVTLAQSMGWMPRHEWQSGVEEYVAWWKTAAKG